MFFSKNQQKISNQNTLKEIQKNRTESMVEQAIDFKADIFNQWENLTEIDGKINIFSQIPTQFQQKINQNMTIKIIK